MEDVNALSRRKFVGSLLRPIPWQQGPCRLRWHASSIVNMAFRNGTACLPNASSGWRCQRLHCSIAPTVTSHRPRSSEALPEDPALGWSRGSLWHLK